MKNLLAAVVEIVYKPHPLFRFCSAIKIVIGQAILRQLLSDHSKHAGKLRKQQHPPAAGNSVCQNLLEQLQFAAAALILFEKESRMTAKLPEPCEESKNFYLTFVKNHFGRLRFQNQLLPGAARHDTASTVRLSFHKSVCFLLSAAVLGELLFSCAA